MGNHRFSREAAEETIRKIEDCLREGFPPPGKARGYGLESAIAGLAKKLNCPRATIDGRLAKASAVYGLTPDWTLWVPPAERTVEPGAGKEPEEPLSERDRRRLNDRINFLTKELRDAHQQINESEDLRKSLFGLVSEPLSPAKFTVKTKKAGRHLAEIPILFTSDFQWGENVNLQEMEGMNSFNIDIARKRYQRLIEGAVDLTLNHHTGPKPPEFIYLRGGDAISGDIHDELRKTNDLSSIPAARDLAEHEARGIDLIAKELGCKIRVISIPGNHGRNTTKPESKRYVETNYEDIIAWFLEMHFRAKGDDRVTFYAPRSGDALFKVFDWQFLLAHGDRIGSRGGMGFIGPAATIARGMKKTYDYYATMGVIIDCMLVGHYHTSLELEYGFANGTLVGPSEYSRDLRAKPKPPTQWLLNVHPRRGITSQWKIHVGASDEGKICETKED